MLSVDEDKEQLELSYTAGGGVKWYEHFGTVFDVSAKTEHTQNLHINSSIPRNIPR